MVENYKKAYQALLDCASDPYVLSAIEHIYTFAILHVDTAADIFYFLATLYRGGKDESLDIFLPALSEKLIPLYNTHLDLIERTSPQFSTNENESSTSQAVSLVVDLLENIRAFGPSEHSQLHEMLDSIQNISVLNAALQTQLLSLGKPKESNIHFATTLVNLLNQAASNNTLAQTTLVLSTLNPKLINRPLQEGRERLTELSDIVQNRKDSLTTEHTLTQILSVMKSHPSVDLKSIFSFGMEAVIQKMPKRATTPVIEARNLSILYGLSLVIAEVELIDPKALGPFLSSLLKNIPPDANKIETLLLFVARAVMATVALPLLNFWEVIGLFPNWFRVPDASLTHRIFTDLVPIYSRVQESHKLKFTFQRTLTMLVTGITLDPLEKYCTLVKRAMTALQTEEFNRYLSSFLTGRIAPLNMLQATRMETVHNSLIELAPKYHLEDIQNIPFINFADPKTIFSHFVDISERKEEPDLKSLYFRSALFPYLTHPDACLQPTHKIESKLKNFFVIVKMLYKHGFLLDSGVWESFFGSSAAHYSDIIHSIESWNFILPQLLMNSEHSTLFSLLLQSSLKIWHQFPGCEVNKCWVDQQELPIDRLISQAKTLEWCAAHGLQFQPFLETLHTTKPTNEAAVKSILSIFQDLSGALGQFLQKEDTLKWSEHMEMLISFFSQELQEGPHQTMLTHWTFDFVLNQCLADWRQFYTKSQGTPRILKYLQEAQLLDWFVMADEEPAFQDRILKPSIKPFIFRYPALLFHIPFSQNGSALRPDLLQYASFHNPNPVSLLLIENFAQTVASKSETLRPQVEKWLARFIGQCEWHHITGDQISDFLPVVGQILELAVPDIKQTMSTLFISFVQTKHSKTFVPFLQKSPNFACLHFLLCAIISDDTYASNKGALDAISNPLRDKFFKRDRQKQNIALRAMVLLTQTPYLTSKEKLGVLLSILPKDIDSSQSWIDPINSLSSITICVQFHLSPKLKTISRNEIGSQLTAIIQQHFQETLGLHKIENFASKYLATLAQWRDPAALFNYTAKLQTLSGYTGKQALVLALSNVMKLTSTYRYDPLYSQHHLAIIWQHYPHIALTWPLGWEEDFEGFTIKHALTNPLTNKGWRVADTDDANTMLLLGSEVDASCLHINGTPSKTQCLLSYLLDGKNRALVITDEDGVVQARCIIRLLLQNNKNQPTRPTVFLFMEEIYHKFSVKKYAPEIAHILETMAIKRAKELNVALVHSPPKVTSSPLRGGPLYSADGHCIHEYVDAIKGQYSYFSIPEDLCQYLWVPPA